MERQRFLELARRMATRQLSDAERQELEALVTREPELKTELQRFREDQLLSKEILPLVYSEKSPATPFPGYARERLRAKVRERLQPAGQDFAGTWETIWVRLRRLLGRRRRVDHDADDPQPPNVAEESEFETAFWGAPIRTKVLLVDDERSFTDSLAMNLKEMGRYDVRVENQPEDAYETVRQFRPDIVFLKIIMPRVPGGNVAAQISNDPELKDTPIVFLTAAVRKHQVEENEGIICDRPCLARPATIDEVIRMIDEHARKPLG